MRMLFWSACLISLILSGLLFAELSDVEQTASGLCQGLHDLLAPVSMVLVLGGAVTYGAGQILGAETRARANVWATVMVTGALTGLLIVAVAPPILKGLYGADVKCDAAGGGPVGGMCGGSPLPSGYLCCENINSYEEFQGGIEYECCNAGDGHACTIDQCCSSGCMVLIGGVWVC